jgi:two-component system, NtrC family, nitrogen regulation response regulator GlnG
LVKDLYGMVMERVERPLIRAVLTETKGNQVRAAQILGINRNTLRRKLGDLNVER